MPTRLRLSFAVAMILPLLLLAVGRAAEFVTLQELQQKDRWTETHLSGLQATLPFSFTYDGQSSATTLPQWSKNVVRKKLDASRTQYTFTWTDPKTALEVRCLAVTYSDYPAIEWTMHFKNTGSVPTPVLKDILGLDANFKRGTGEEFVLNGIQGDWCAAESYQPYRLILDPGTKKQFSPPPESGKSSDGPTGWPYYNLQMPGGGVMLAIGWPGQWASAFTRDAADSLRVTAGQQLTHLRLNPGEEVRAPLIAMLFYQGSDLVRAQNLWRRWFLDHNIPRVDGQLPPPMISMCPSPLAEQTDANCRAATEIITAPGSKLTALWIDAGWYPCDDGPYTGNDRWLNTGTWEADAKRLPNGFREFSDALHAKGKQFILWFEPERVGDTNSWLARNHPEWLLPGSSHGSLLNEGHPEARRWLVNHVDGMIKSQGIDWYREDMNGGGPLPAWRRNDTPDRQGITENFYVQGHLSYWDELLQRNSKLRIDACASGGRRNDLESMRRAVPLCRTDFVSNSRSNAIATQSQTLALAAWLPYFGNAGFFTEPFIMRSYYAPSMTPWDGPAVAGSQKAYEECSLVAPLMSGDFFPLTEYSLASDVWLAWQFNRPEQGDGFVQAFRRPDVTKAAQTFRLHGLDPASLYEVTNFDVKGATHVSGKDLMEKGLTIEIPDKPGAAVIMYRRGK